MSRTLPSKMSKSAAALLCAGLIGGLLTGSVGCKGRQPRAKTPETNKPVNTGLSRLANEPSLALPENDEMMAAEGERSIKSQIEESARQLSVYFANLEMDGAPSVDAASRERIPAEPVNPTPAHASGDDRGPGTAATPGGAGQPSPSFAHESTRDGGGVRVSLLGASGGREPGAGSEPPADEPVAEQAQPEAEIESEPEPEPVDPQQRRDELASELASILSELASTSSEPGSAALALAALETVLPSDVDALVEQGILSDAEKASLDAARELLRSMQSGGSIASPIEVSEKLEQIQAQLDGWAGLTITKAALCTSVYGYGRYETFPSYRFIAGRPQEVIVYTELARFAQRHATGPDGQARYEVELSQRLELYHVADDLNTWNRAAETVRDESRNRLRDYYLTNQVRLPGTLGVGRYHLKIVMRDLVGDKTAETIIPIEIVAR